MASAKYIGYLGGAAVAAGLGAAVAVAGQGVAQADSTDAKPTSAEAPDSPGTAQKSTQTSKKGPGAKLTEAIKGAVDAGPKRPVVKVSGGIVKDLPAVKKPGVTFDPDTVVQNLKKTFSTSNPVKKPAPVSDTAADTPDDADEAPAADTEAAVSRPLRPLAQLAENVSQFAATVTKPIAKPVAEPDIAPMAAFEPEVAAAAAGDWFLPNDAPVPWSWNPFRESDPIPNDMPETVWQLEQWSVDLFDAVPIVQPFVREGFEAGYRFSQFIPWVNVVVPLSNIVGDVPNLVSGDPVLFRDATQSIINNLIVTIQPVAILFYGYDEIADFLNVEYEAQQAKVAFYRISWDLIDFFGLLHNKGESGLPLSSNPAGATGSLETSRVVPEAAGETAMFAAFASTAADASVAATVAGDDPLSDPFRADDPDPKGVPAAILAARDALLAPLPAELQPYVREGFELAYRGSQVVPYVNAVIPITEILPGLLLAAQGDKAGAQVAVNQLLVTTPTVSALYYGYDAVADLLNVEDAAWQLKNDFYATAWDTIDFANLLHNEGESGLETVTV